jgi:hypothetical protein
VEGHGRRAVVERLDGHGTNLNRGRITDYFGTMVVSFRKAPGDPERNVEGLSTT